MFNYSFPQIFFWFCTQILSKDILILKLIFVWIPKSCPLDNLHSDQLFQQQPTTWCVTGASNEKESMTKMPNTTQAQA